jgi:hypothetical protein
MRPGDKPLSQRRAKSGLAHLKVQGSLAMKFRPSTLLAVCAVLLLVSIAVQSLLCVTVLRIAAATSRPPLKEPVDVNIKSVSPLVELPVQVER